MRKARHRKKPNLSLHTEWLRFLAALITLLTTILKLLARD